MRVININHDDRSWNLASRIKYQGLPQFHPPAYQSIQGEIQLLKNAESNYVFCEVERDKDGVILRSLSGQSVLQQPL